MSTNIQNSGTIAHTDSGAYTDLNRLSQLKVGDRDSDANKRKVAQEFESLFLNEMLKSMRSANDVLAKDNPMNTPAARQWQDMYDQQLSVNMSRNGGIGLADVMMRQLSRDKPAEKPDASTNEVAFADLQRPLRAQAVKTESVDRDTARDDRSLFNARRISLPSRTTDRLLAGLVPSADGAQAGADNEKALRSRTVVAGESALSSKWKALAKNAQSHGNVLTASQTAAQIPLAPSKAQFESPDDFVATMMPMAEAAAARIGIDPTYLVAQAALETGWGKSIMRAQDGGSSYNLFGIKAAGSWDGDSARAITSEFRDGQMVKETASFRAYTSYADSFNDLVSFLQNNPRYQETLKAADKPEQFVRELQKAGYATDPNYASKISQIAKQMKGSQDYASASTSTTL